MDDRHARQLSGVNISNLLPVYLFSTNSPKQLKRGVQPLISCRPRIPHTNYPHTVISYSSSVHEPEGSGFHLSDKIFLTMWCRSSSATEEFGGIGTSPQSPSLPFFTLSMSRCSALLSRRYFAATSRNAGPTTFLSIV